MELAYTQETKEKIVRTQICLSNSFSTIRNGRICIPVKKEYKFKIGGTVIDKSSTGNTLFIEPKEVGKERNLSIISAPVDV